MKEKGEPYYDGDAGLGQDTVMYKNNIAAAMALRAACGRMNNKLIKHTPQKIQTAKPHEKEK